MAAAAKKSKGLGRGLDALLGGAQEPLRSTAKPEPAAGDIRRLPIEFLKANPDQPRRVFKEEMIAELAASLKSRGMIQPILVRPSGGDAYEIVAGERRWRAAQKAGLHEVPVIIRVLSDAETAELALVENLQRVDLNPMEEARAYQALAELHDRTQEEIAEAVGKSRSHVANMMRLMKLPEKVQDAVRDDVISMGHARALLAAKDAEQALKDVMKGALSVRETERLVAGDAPKKAAGARPAPKGGSGGAAADGAPARALKDADTRALENDLAAALGLEVEIDHTRKGAGAVTIRYLNLDQLDDVCRRLMGASV